MVATSHLGREGVQRQVLSLSTSVKFLNALDSFLNKYLLIFQGHVTRGENTQVKMHLLTHIQAVANRRYTPEEPLGLQRPAVPHC